MAKKTGYFQKDLGIVIEKKPPIIFTEGQKTFLWSVHYADPCQLDPALIYSSVDCDISERKFNPKAENLIKNCKSAFVAHSDRLAQIVPTTDHNRRPRAVELAKLYQETFLSRILSRERRQTIFDAFSTVGIFADFAVGISAHKRVSTLKTSFDDFKSDTERKFSDLSQEIINVATISNQNTERIVNFATGICKAILDQTDYITNIHLENVFYRFYNSLMSESLTFSNNELPLNPKFYLDLIIMCTKVQNQAISEPLKHQLCTKLIRSKYFKIEFAGLELIKSSHSSIQINLNITVPIISEQFLKYSSFEIFNSGYFKNSSMFELNLPNRFIKHKNEFISIQNSCTGKICRIQDLIFSNSVHCIENIMLDKPLHFCTSKKTINQFCNTVDLSNGILLTAQNSLIMYKSKSTKSVIKSTTLIFGEGRILCQTNHNNSFTYIFDTNGIEYNTYVKLDKVNLTEYMPVNITLTKLEKISKSQTMLANSHYTVNKVPIGTDLIIFSGLLLTLVVLGFIIWSQYNKILVSFAICKKNWYRNQNPTESLEPAENSAKILSTVTDLNL